MKHLRSQAARGWRGRTSLLALALALPATASHPVELADPADIIALGRSIFFDTDLSMNRDQACASCHDPARGFTPLYDPGKLEGAVVGGSVQGRAGNRKPPSAAYASFSPAFHHTMDDGDVLFVGGAFLDGRATGHKLGTAVADQALGPFLNPLEMALPHEACVVDRVLNPADPAYYAVSFAEVWGAEAAAVALPEEVRTACATPGAAVVIDDEDLAAQVETAYSLIAYTVAAFESSSEVNRFSSRFDAWRAGAGDFTDQEKLGFEVFVAEDKGNCAACHVVTPNTHGGPPVFTDWTFDNLGVPRNRDNPFYEQAEANPAGRDWIDPGLGAFLETDPVYAAHAAANLGKQQVPTLRNLTLGAETQPRTYMHNGYFRTLEGVVRFYNTRDTAPRCADPWASEAEAMAQGCWPAPEVEANVNTDELGDLKLTAAEEAALVAFLRTLDDR